MKGISQMKSKTAKFKISWLVLQLILIAVFIISAFFQYRGRFQQQTLTPASGVYYLTMGNYDMEQDSYSVDETSGTPGIFTCGPYMTMKKGIYDVTVYYESTGSGHTAYATSEDSAYYANGVKSDQISLDSHHTSKSFRIQLGRDVEDFEVQTVYGGNGSLTVRGISVSQGITDSIHTLFLRISALLFLNIFVFLCYLWKSQKPSREKILAIASLTGIIVFSSLPLLKDGFPRYTTDVNFFLMRVEGLKNGLLSGDFPVRIQPGWLNGYGYATSLFYNDLFLYLPALLRMFGVSVQNAYFIYQFCINGATCLIAYFCFKGIFRQRGISLIGSGLYTLSAHRLMLLYYTTRGGMFTAYTFLPLVFYGVYLIYHDSQNVKSWLYTCLGMTVLLHCHLLSAEMTVLTLILTILFTARSFFKKEPVLAMLKATVAAVILNLGFLIPMTDYMGEGFYVSSEAWKTFYNYIQNEGLDLSGFLDLFRGVESYHSPDMILVCGVLLYFVLLLCIPRAQLSEEAQHIRKVGNVSAGLSVILCFMSTRYFPWDWIEETFEALRMPINSIQYPNRFIEIALLTMTITACCGLFLLKEKTKEQQYHYAVLGILFTLLLSSGWMLSSILNLDTYQSIYDAAYLDTSRISTKEYLPEGADPDLYTNEGPIAGIGVSISDFSRKGLHLSLQCENTNAETGLIELPLVYYKGYHATDATGTELILTSNDNYSIDLIVPAGYSGTVSIDFKSPVSWTIGMWISLIWGIGLVGYVCMKKRKH